MRPGRVEAACSCRGSLSCSQRWIDHRVEIITQSSGVHSRQMRSTANLFSHRHSLGTQRAEFGDWLAATGHRHSLASGNPIDDLTTVVAEFPDRHIDHSHEASRMRHRGLGLTRTRTRLADRLSLHRARWSQERSCTSPGSRTFSAWCLAASSGPGTLSSVSRHDGSRCHLAAISLSPTAHADSGRTAGHRRLTAR